jgi:hypothetical protein
MLHLPRPWSSERLDAFGATDCLISEVRPLGRSKTEHTVLLKGVVQGQPVDLLLHPYPRAGSGKNPTRQGFPIRPPKMIESETEEDLRSQALLRRMNEVLARVQELGESLDEPAHVWPRLKAAWERAEREDDPRMAEIIRQAREILPKLKDLEPRIRKVLRRTRELVPLDRVREMDRASMRWLVRQPGSTIAERAGSSQRILATVRRENFDTAENRVLHAYAVLASDVARQWMKEHPKARASRRYEQVDALYRFCKSFSRLLAELDVMVADAGITPNYVLMQDGNYRAVYDAWMKLLKHRLIEDDLWAWQAETWTDFCVLSIILALHDVEDCELVSQSPIFWRSEASLGRWFEQDNPIAVFWLKRLDRVVEVHSRPSQARGLLAYARAHVALRITDPSRVDVPRTVAVWTPHTLDRIDIKEAVVEANKRLTDIQKVSTSETLRQGLILTPANGLSEVIEASGPKTNVQGIALDPAGTGLKLGLDAIRAFARGDIYRSPTK